VRFTKEFQDFSTAAVGERLLTDEPPTYQAAVIEQREEAFRKLVSGEIQPMPGLMTLLALAGRASLPIVAVGKASRRNAEMLLSVLGMVHRFKAIVIGDELPHDKPHPMPYLEDPCAASAASNLSIAFEDSRSGIQSAPAAGIAPSIGLGRLTETCRPVPCGSVSICCLQAGRAGPGRKARNRSENRVAVL
jgi:beta-phosphoglucomutase-like phosphatase (HAD superfamily)